MQRGFFPKRVTTTAKTRTSGKAQTCAECALYKTCHSPKMEAYGNFKRGILNVGEAPGEIEDKTGKPWQGRTGKLLQTTYKELGIDLFEDCLNINAVACRPTEDDNNRTPTNFEIDCCRSRVLQVITERKPKVIVLLGNAAIYSVIGHRWKNDLGGVTKWRGWTIPDQDFGCWVCPTFHPSYVERDETEASVTIWKNDLKSIITIVDTPLPVNITPRINVKDDLSVLDTIQEKYTRIAFDYETTGLKPHAPGHRIICVSVAVSVDNVFVFMLPPTKLERLPLIRLLANPLIEKMAHNMKYEQTWSIVRLHTPVANWYWDSMLAAHVLDNRSGTAGLKFQVYVNFGVIDYSSAIGPYLKSKEDLSANDFNQINTLLNTPDGPAQLLQYCALDSIWEFRLATKQMAQIGVDNIPYK